MDSSVCVLRWPVLLLISSVGLIFSCALSIPPRAASDTGDIDRLIHQLGSGSFREREKAMDSLRSIGQPALPALRRAQSSGDPEIRRRAKSLVAELDTGVGPLLKLGARFDFNRNLPGSPVECAYLHNGVFRDADLIHLREFDKLYCLTLFSSKITDQGLAHIGHLSNLEVLALRNTSITDLTHLRKLTKLVTLGLSHTRITDAGLAPVKGFTSLQSLSLFKTNITDSGLMHLQGLKKLRNLDLSRTKITDKGLTYLEGLEELTDLNLSHTQITDAGLSHLRGLKKAHFIMLFGTHVTKEGIDDLKKALPNLDQRALPKLDKQ